MHWRIIEHKITLPFKSKHLLFDEHSSDTCFVKWCHLGNHMILQNSMSIQYNDSKIMVWLVGPSCTSVVLQCCCKVSCWSWIQTNGPKLNDVPQKHGINSLERIPCRSSSHPACKFIWNAMSRLINVRPIYWFGNYLTYSATFTIYFLES